MGKYMKKSKITADVAVMELSQSTTLPMGVRTRAKTLALQRLLSPSTADAAPNQPDSSSLSYLQLRSRRLEKPSLLLQTKKPLDQPKPSPNKKFNKSFVKAAAAPSSTGGCQTTAEGEAEDFGVEASFGENFLEFEPRERSIRESTPCSLIRDSDTTGTPGSTTRKSSSTATNQRVRSDVQRNVPTTHEMEEFFACAEQKQQRLFIEKYNFDVVNDLPLPGRYEWVQVIP